MSNSQNSAQAPSAKAEDQAVPKRERRLRPGVGGFAQKLDAPERPGWVRRWVNGDPLRIQRMEQLGYSLVAETAGEGSKRTEGLGSRITRHAGKDENGKPYHTVLMETPADLYQQGEAEKEEVLRKPFDEAIRRGQDTQKEPIEGAYTPSTRSSITHSG